MKKFLTLLAIASFALSINAADNLTVNCGDSVWISATPAKGYKFVSWQDGNTDNPRKVIVTGNLDYQATFAPDKFKLNITVDNGTVTGAGEYEYGSTVTITVTPDDCYHFAGWSDGSKELTRTVTITGDMTLHALCEIDTFTVNVETNAAAMGSVSVVLIEQ